VYGFGGVRPVLSSLSPHPAPSMTMAAEAATTTFFIIMLIDCPLEHDRGTIDNLATALDKQRPSADIDHLTVEQDGRRKRAGRYP
jgi:hypothetical protein